MSERGAASKPPLRPPVAEVEREQHDSAFTPILRDVRAAVPSVLAAAFVDVEGECIDCVSSIDPYDAQVTAAHLLVLLSAWRDARRRLGLSDAIALEIAGAERELWARRVSDDYMLAIVLAPGFDRVQLRAASSRAAAAFRDEVELDAPAWETAVDSLEVRVRPSMNWSYAPDSFRQDGSRIGIADVLGRWTESTPGRDEQLVCFRVRTDEGREVTLVHDPDIEDWRVRG